MRAKSEDEDEISGEDLERKISKAISLHRKPAEVELTGVGMRLGVRVLNRREMQMAEIDAMRSASSDAKSAGVSVEEMTVLSPDFYDRHVNGEIVRRAFFDPSTLDQPEPTRAFPSRADLDRLGNAMLGDLAEAYREHEVMASPLRTMTEEELVKVVETLGKEGNEEAAMLYLGELGFDTLKGFALIMARRLATYPTSKSSGISASADS